MEYLGNLNNNYGSTNRQHKRQKTVHTSSISCDASNVSDFSLTNTYLKQETECFVDLSYTMDSPIKKLALKPSVTEVEDCSIVQQNENDTTIDNCSAECVQPLPRPILNTSMIKISTESQHEQQQPNQLHPDQIYTSKISRAPLSIVLSNSNIITKSDETLCKKPVDVAHDNDFFLFKLWTPQLLNTEYFSKLSDEMILAIFKWLPKKALMRCSYVCQRFCIVSHDESLWTRLDMASKHIRACALGKILQRGIVIFRLAQSKIADPIFEPTDTAINFMCKLQYLDLSMAVISKTGLKELLSRCRMLKKLSLEHVAVDTSICVEIGENKNLEALNLAMSEGINETSVRILMQSLQLLQSLNISWTSLNTEAIKIFVETVPTDLIRLNIAGCRKSMTDLYLNILVNRCPNLIELDLSDCVVLSSDAVKIVSKLTKLEYLSLSRCYNISIASYLAINELISLGYLDIFGVLSDQALKTLRQSFPSVGINQFIYSAVARPTVGTRRTSIWGLRTRD